MERTVPLPQEEVDAFREIRESAATEDDFDTVASLLNGTPGLREALDKDASARVGRTIVKGLKDGTILPDGVGRLVSASTLPIDKKGDPAKSTHTPDS